MKPLAAPKLQWRLPEQLTQLRHLGGWLQHQSLCCLLSSRFALWRKLRRAIVAQAPLQMVLLVMVTVLLQTLRLTLRLACGALAPVRRKQVRMLPQLQCRGCNQ